MRRYRDQGDLRKLTPVTSSSYETGKRPSPTKEELEEAEIKHYAIIDAAAAIASSQVSDRLTRLFFGVIGFVAAAGGAVYVALDQQIRNTASEIVNTEFDERGNEIFGFFVLQRRLIDIERRFELETSALERDVTFDGPEGSTDQSARVLADGITRELASFMEGLGDDAETPFPELDGYTITSGDRIYMESELADSIERVATFSRNISYYEPVTTLYFASPQIATQSERFMVNFTYASGIELLSEQFLVREVENGFELAELYRANRNARRQLVNWPELSALFGLLIEAELGATTEQLTSIAAPMADLNPGDMNSLMRTIVEIGIDSDVEPAYRLAGERTLATFRTGCDVGGFIPASVCSDLNSSGVWEYFEADTGAGLTSVGLSSAYQGPSVEAGSWAPGLGGRISSTDGARALTEDEQNVKSQALKRLY